MSPPTDTIDLSGAVPLESFTLEILHPLTSQPTGWKIHLAGPQHEASIAVAGESGKDFIEEELAIKVAAASGQKYDPAAETLQARRRKHVGRTCRRILGWSPNPTFRNIQPDPIEFSVSTATEMFLRPDMAGFFIQITKYLNSEKAFMPPSDPV
jgi:hypothetical protein